MRLNRPPARFLAIPPEYMALEARLDAWLNLSQRENARVFVIVRTRAMTGWWIGVLLARLFSLVFFQGKEGGKRILIEVSSHLCFPLMFSGRKRLSSEAPTTWKIKRK